MPLSLFHIYTINGFDHCYIKKKNIKKSHIYTHKSASGRPLLLIILVFDSREFTSNLSCKYFDTMIEPPYFIKPSIYTVRMYILLIACLTCN